MYPPPKNSAIWQLTHSLLSAFQIKFVFLSVFINVLSPRKLSTLSAVIEKAFVSNIYQTTLQSLGNVRYVKDLWIKFMISKHYQILHETTTKHCSVKGIYLKRVKSISLRRLYSIDVNDECQGKSTTFILSLIHFFVLLWLFANF